MVENSPSFAFRQYLGRIPSFHILLNVHLIIGCDLCHHATAYGPRLVPAGIEPREAIRGRSRISTESRDPVA